MSSTYGNSLRRLRRFAGICVICVAVAGKSYAAKDSKPGSTTVWDSLMAEQAVRHLQIGAEAFSRGDYGLATKYFARAVSSNPEDPRTHLMLGVAQYWSGAVDEAMAAYRVVLKLDPKSAHAHQLLGIAYAWKGDMPNALAEFQAAVALEPDRPDIQMDLGSVYETLGERQKALDCFRRAVALDPRFPLYQYQLGTLYDKLGRESAAQETLKEAIRLFPEFQDAILQLGSVKQRAGDLDGAAQLFKKAVKVKPGDAVARLRFGLVHLLQGNPERVSEDLDKAFALTPEQEGGKLALSQAYAAPAKGEDPATPLGMFQRNLERIPAKQEAKVQVTLSRVSHKPADLQPASEGTSTLKTAMSRAFTGPTAVRTQREFTLPPASPEVRAAQIENVIKELRQTTAPGDGGEVHLGMNISYPKREFEESSEVHPVSYEPRRVGNDLGLWVQGSGWVELVEEVVPVLKDRITEKPTDVQAKVLLGLAYLTLGNAPEARGAFEEALAVNAQSFDALLGLGVAHVISGNDAQALETYRKALALKPKDRTARDAVKWLSTPISSGKKESRIENRESR